MSRIGKKPIELPKGVEVKHDGNVVTVKGPKGTLQTPVVSGIGVKVEGNVLTFTRADEENKTRAYHGLMRALVANNIRGVSEGFKRELDIVGVGYRAEVKGKEVVFQLGYSHPVRFPIPEGISMECPSQTEIVIKGIDRQKLGQVCAKIRAIRPPEPYKGKGVRYTGEKIELKEGKKK